MDAASSPRSPQPSGRLGVRAFLFLLLSASALVPVALLGIREATKSAAYELAAADRQTVSSARVLVGQIHASITGYVRALTTLAAQIRATGELEGDRVRDILYAHGQHHPEFFITYVARADATSLMYYSRQRGFEPGGVNYRDRDYYRELVQTREPAISKVQIGRVSKVPGVQLAAPILGEAGDLQGLVCSPIDLTKVAETARHAAAGLDEGRLLVLDRQSRIIADSAGGDVTELAQVPELPLFAPLQPEEAVSLRDGVDDHGREVRAAVVALEPPVADWRVVAMRGKRSVEAPARETRWQTALLSLITLLAAFVTAAVVASWSGKPLRALATAAQDVADGQRVRIPESIRGGPSEFRILTHAVVAMVDRLRGHRQELETQVRDRTLELSRTNDDLADTVARLERAESDLVADIEQARLFQARLLPTLPKPGRLEFAARYLPLQRVSGDIYDVHELSPGRYRVFIADATGHGVQASLRTIALKTAYDRFKNEKRELPELMDALNRQLVEEFPDGDLHSAAVCLDVRVIPSGALVTYSMAGATPMIHFSRSGASEVHAGGALLGVSEDVEWDAAFRLEASPGDLLLVCSDGVSEQWNERRERFDTDGLLDLGLQRATTAEQAADRLLEGFHSFRNGQAVSDDVTFVAIKLC